MMHHLNMPAVCGHHAPPEVSETERRVTQYGPEWMEHVANGGAVRSGNILVGAVVDPARVAALRTARRLSAVA